MESASSALDCCNHVVIRTNAAQTASATVTSAVVNIARVWRSADVRVVMRSRVAA